MESFCFVMKVDSGCLLIGTISFVLSFAATVSSAVLLFLQHNGVFTVDELLGLTDSSSTIFLAALLIVDTVWLIASILLLIGINKHKPGCVLFYFAFGIMVTILLQLGALLELLAGKWSISIIQFFLSLFYIHCLMVIYQFYEHIQNFNHKPLDEEPILLDSDSQNV